ncbi:hypothetical protein GCM10023340_01630 [Nocardioides marinquilinus]|uniref:CARDB domain-containing protein n=1 Tax=Nocardioides marinquilinus TaxID=1210400 RepID=A0ABP9P559_9ACTN
MAQNLTRTPRRSRATLALLATVALAPGLAMTATLGSTPAADAAPAQARPNLRVASVEAPSSVAQGGTLVTTVVVRNTGKAAAGTSSVRVSLSTDKRVGTDRALSPTTSIPGLRAGAAASGRARATVPLSTTPGRYHVVVCAHATKRVRESDEGDNCTVGPQVTVTRRGGGGTGGAGLARGSLTWTFADEITGDDWAGHEDESGSLELVLKRQPGSSTDWTNAPGSRFESSGVHDLTWFRHRPDGCGDTTTHRTSTASGAMLPDRAFAVVDKASGDLFVSAGISHPGTAIRHVEARCVQTYDETYDLLGVTPPCTRDGLTPVYRLEPVRRGSRTYEIDCSYSWTSEGPDGQHHVRTSTVEGRITLPAA